MKKLVKILKKIKIRNLIILVLLLVFNSYAWFIYATKVTMGFNAHVSSWSVEFITADGESIKELIVDVERIFPGMEIFEKSIEIFNKGETKANLSYEIESFKLMGEEFIVGENITTEELEHKLETEYPFKITIIHNENGFSTGTGNDTFSVTIEWPFESGNDALDTSWGNKAYEFYSLNPGEKSLELKLSLTATQAGGN